MPEATKLMMMLSPNSAWMVITASDQGRAHTRPSRSGGVNANKIVIPAPAGTL